MLPICSLAGAGYKLQEYSLLMDCRQYEVVSLLNTGAGVHSRGQGTV